MGLQASVSLTATGAENIKEDFILLCHGRNFPNNFYHSAGVVEVPSGDAGFSVERDTVVGQVFFDEIGNLAANV